METAKAFRQKNLPRTYDDGKEVVILDDYDGTSSRALGVYDTLTCRDRSQLRVMGDYETQRYVKGVIIPTTDVLER